MPELPEVEATVRYLRERIVGTEISRCQVLWERTVSPLSVANFARALVGRRVSEVFRRGKYIGIVVDLARLRDDRLFLLCHLRMSGNLDVLSSEIPLDRHDRLCVHLKGGKDIRFNDPRKFGRMYLLRDPDVILDKLGLEPLGSDFTSTAFFQILCERRTAIKTLLLNQALISGIGNIYADEALWRARIHPMTPSIKISQSSAGLLRLSIQKILKEAIRFQGTDIGDGVVGYGSYRTRVYGREGSSCKRCREIIEKIVVGQRGTHFCPGCQVLARK